MPGGTLADYSHLGDRVLGLAEGRDTLGERVLGRRLGPLGDRVLDHIRGKFGPVGGLSVHLYVGDRVLGLSKGCGDLEGSVLGCLLGPPCPGCRSLGIL